MDTPIKPRTVKPRVKPLRGHLLNRYEDRRSLTIRVKRPYWFMCYDDNVAAVGKTIEGAYKNWVSLKLDYLHMMNRLAPQIRGTVTSEYYTAQFSSGMDYRCR